MALEQLVVFNIALLVAIASPGSALLMATHTSVSRGRTAGVAVGIGLGLMAAIWTMMALLGLGLVFELFPMVYIGVHRRKILRGPLSLIPCVQNVEERIRPHQCANPTGKTHISARLPRQSYQSEIRTVRGSCSCSRISCRSLYR